MKVNSLSELPTKYECRLCDTEKPIAEMVVVRLRKENKILLRPRCKECHNKRERGHRRAYKTKYLRRWRKWHPDLNRSYWTQRQSEKRKELNARAYQRFSLNHFPILIQGRLRRRLGMKVSINDAQKLFRKFGPCYPTAFGLTDFGRKEFERIRSSMRRIGKKIHPVELRMMLYDDGHFIKPRRQPIPFKRAAAQLRNWHRRAA